MYISITPQKSGAHYAVSSADFVSYLEKENEKKPESELEYFFNSENDDIRPETVVAEIDTNTAKLKKTEPRFYSITLNPSRRELAQLTSNDQLKEYTREVMHEYATCFNREIHGRPVQTSDIKYYAKLETQRFFKGTDWQVKENQPFAAKIIILTSQQRRIARGEEQGSIKKIQQQIDKLEQQAPHKINNVRITQGMPKPGNQAHIHIIVSRKDRSNSYSLSPGSKYKASEVLMNGKKVKRGFDRDRFFAGAERKFDQKFDFSRNFVESYHSRKMAIQNPKKYFKELSILSYPQKRLAFQLLRESGLKVPAIPVSKVQVASKLFKQLKSSMGMALKSSSIGY